MLSAAQWIETLAPNKSWREAYPVVAHQAREVLGGITDPISTAQLANTLWPTGTITGVAGIKVRARIFQALKAMATRELAAYARRGDPYHRKIFNRGRWSAQVARPWLWADYGIANAEAISRPKCPHCGGEL
jgi:hypothetical protein